MIGYIEGRLGAIRGNRVIVHTPGGVGYELALPLSVLADVAGHKTVALHVVTVVKDDAIDLYGFAAAEAKALFERLIGVSGIGPRVALAVLSGIEPSELVRAIRGGDVGRLTRIPGIGRKTAERMVLELKDRMPEGAEPHADDAVPDGADVRADVLSALANLGYQAHLVERAVDRVLKDAADRSFEFVLRQVLREMAR